MKTDLQCKKHIEKVVDEFMSKATEITREPTIEWAVRRIAEKTNIDTSFFVDNNKDIIPERVSSLVGKMLNVTRILWENKVNHYSAYPGEKEIFSITLWGEDVLFMSLKEFKNFINWFSWGLFTGKVREDRWIKPSYYKNFTSNCIIDNANNRIAKIFKKYEFK